MRFNDYKCSKEECKTIVKDHITKDGEDPPKYVKCPECGSRAYRVFGGSNVLIPEHFKATTTTPGNTWTKNRMKNYKGQNGKKRFY